MLQYVGNPSRILPALTIRFEGNDKILNNYQWRKKVMLLSKRKNESKKVSRQLLGSWQIKRLIPMTCCN